MQLYIRKFIYSEDGATTVDWVMITALAMSMGLAAFGGISSGTKDLTSDVSSTVSTRPIQTNF